MLGTGIGLWLGVLALAYNLSYIYVIDYAFLTQSVDSQILFACVGKGKAKVK